MSGERHPSIEFADIGRLVREAPNKSRDNQREINEPDATMNIGPKWPRRALDLVEEQPEAAEKDNQRRHNPVESDSGRSVARLRQRYR